MSNFLKEENSEESSWLSVSDLMAGLMMVFLFISIVLMRQAFIDKENLQEQKQKVEEVIEIYSGTQEALYKALEQEFREDFVIWNAELNAKTLTISFKAIEDIQNPKILFNKQKQTLTPHFEGILAEFFPRYIQVLTNGYFISEKGQVAFKEVIKEVRIEGHSSSEWSGATSEQDAYFNNMSLSQGRTMSVLEYGTLLEAVQGQQAWIRNKFAAVGLSSSKPIYLEAECNQVDSSKRENCTEDKVRSKRVDFRVMTNAEEQIQKIIAKSL